LGGSVPVTKTSTEFVVEKGNALVL
jgi:hypothetical protein